MTNPPPLAEKLTLRTLDLNDLGKLLLLSAEQRWPHREEDWLAASRLGSGIVAVVDDEIVGCAMYWLWGQTHATIGLVIVSGNARGCGIGGRLTGHVLEKLVGRTVCLHSTEDGRGLYERFGFHRTGQIHQHQGMPGNFAPAPLPAGWRLRHFGDNDMAAVSSMDYHARGWRRPELLSLWASDAIDAAVLERHGQLVGYAIARRFGRGVSIGPVVSLSEAGALAMIMHLAGRSGDALVRIDLTAQESLGRQLAAAGLPCVGTATAMTRPAIQSPGRFSERPAELYALATQAFG